MNIKYVDMWQPHYQEKEECVMKCEISVIPIILLQLDYLVYCLDNYANDTPTQTSL